MKECTIIANWKSNKTKEEARAWFAQIASLLTKDAFSGKHIILCPSFSLLPFLKQVIRESQLPFFLGAQDVSPYGAGAYTGAVNALQLKEHVSLVLVGHSEQRKYFHETTEERVNKTMRAKEQEIAVMYCLPEQNEKIPQGVSLIAYEPPGSISPGPADTPENAETIASVLKQQYNTIPVLYGGNVTKDNVKSFITMPHIDGVLVGRASLDPEHFAAIIHHA